MSPSSKWNGKSNSSYEECNNREFSLKFNSLLHSQQAQLKQECCCCHSITFSFFAFLLLSHPLSYYLKCGEVCMYLLLSTEKEHSGSSNGKIFNLPWQLRIKWRLLMSACRGGRESLYMKAFMVKQSRKFHHKPHQIIDCSISIDS